MTQKHPPTSPHLGSGTHPFPMEQRRVNQPSGPAPRPNPPHRLPRLGIQPRKPLEQCGPRTHGQRSKGVLGNGRAVIRPMRGGLPPGKGRKGGQKRTQRAAVEADREEGAAAAAAALNARQRAAC